MRSRPPIQRHTLWPTPPIRISFFRLNFCPPASELEAGFQLLWPTFILPAVCSRSQSQEGECKQNLGSVRHRYRDLWLRTSGDSAKLAPDYFRRRIHSPQPPMPLRRATSASDPQSLIEGLPIELLERIILFTPPQDIIRLSSVRYQSSLKFTSSLNVGVPEDKSRFP